MPDIEGTRTCIDGAIEDLPAQWASMYEYFTDRERFPDGATFVLNTQYSLYDQCTGPYGRVPFAEEQIQRFNRAAELEPALTRDDTIAIDHYPHWLGHARNAADVTCPHYDVSDHEEWLFIDGTHPTPVGQCQLATKAEAALDRMYGACSP
jgi:hypothetical protein